VKIFTLQTVVMGHKGAGTGFASPVKLFESEALAKQALEEHGGQVRSVIETGKIIMMTEQGPKAVMSVAQFLSIIGVGSVAHTILGGEVSGSVLVVPPSAIIVPGQN